MRKPRLAGLAAMGLACALTASAIADPKGPGELSRGPGLGGPRDGDVVVNHPPLNTGGGASDTSFYYPYPWQYWNREADDILLTASAVIGEVRWWGFYHEGTPPVEEVMRVRFYGTRASDGLPDEANLVYEETFANPMRTATGRIILVDEGPPEYQFIAELTVPVSLAAGLRHWLEIVQVGDANSTFRWEFSPTSDGSGFAFINPDTVDWRRTIPGLTVDNAYQLISVPEPTVFGVFWCVLILAGRRRGRKAVSGVNEHQQPITLSGRPTSMDVL